MGGKVRVAARIIISRPGRMTVKGREEIATWATRVVTRFVKRGAEYVDTGKFTAKYYYTDKGDQS